MDLVDTHCHLQFEKLKNNLEQVLEDAKKVGVKKMVCVGTTLTDSGECIKLAEELDNVSATVGVHPHDAQSFLDDNKSAGLFTNLLNKSSICAIGEVGLDYFKDYCPREAQRSALRQQLELSAKHNLPYIFHVRDAWEDFWAIYDEFKTRGVIHSFSASELELEQVLSRGLYVGLNGIMTFTHDQAQLAAAKAVPLESLVLETDAPFLAPKPFRGQLCEPKHVALTADFLARLRGESLQELTAATTKNAEGLFGI